MPRAFLIKKHFGVNPASKSRKSQQKYDSDGTIPSHIEHTIPSDWTPPRTPSVDLVTTPPPPPLLTTQRNPLTSLVDPFEANTWNKSVIPPHVPFNVSSAYSSFVPQQAAYYRGAALYAVSMPNEHDKKTNPFTYNLWDLKKSEEKTITGNSSIPQPEITSKKSAQREAPRYQCPDCKKSYSTLSGLNKHQQFHCLTQAQKSFNCKYCDKVYVSLGALKMHIRTHTLPCKCKLCGKAFSRPWLLQGHVRTHTGEKPFACQHCNRAFADRSNLRAHLQTHSDVKKYSCTNCSKTFSRMSLLIKHKDNGCCRD